MNVLILEKALTLELRHFEDSELYDKHDARPARTPRLGRSAS